MKKIILMVLTVIVLLSSPSAIALMPKDSGSCKVQAFGFQEEQLSVHNTAYWEILTKDCKGGFMVNMHDTATGNAVASVIFNIQNDFQHTTGRFVAAPQGSLILQAYRITPNGDVIYLGSSIQKGKPEWGYYPVLEVTG
ncbi:hypothetical protein JW968_02165 [Candidatus Woesearchaeota archaeon]|nr:hypothetical protein [Candidatus Woesearchaeota archaeon]